MAPRVSLIVAMAQNGVIGRDQGLPWRLSEDLKRFKSTTLGKPMLMGRKTFESIGRALPGRVNLVMSRAAGWAAPGAVTVHSLAEALAQAAEATELVVIGGAEIFRLVLPCAWRIYLTRVHAEVAGDTYFPEFDAAQWVGIEAATHPADERNTYAVTFVTLERRSAAAARAG